LVPLGGFWPDNSQISLEIDHPGEDERKLDRLQDGQGKQKDTLTVNEFRLYSLIFENKTALY
jgi:prophage antirepressor-like protein